MILNDIANEYKYVKDRLEESYEYFNAAEFLVDNYNSKLSIYTSNFLKSLNNESTRSNLASSLAKLTSDSFLNVTKLIPESYIFYNNVENLRNHSFISHELGQDILAFCYDVDIARDTTNKIIVGQLDIMKKDELLSKLVNLLGTVLTWRDKFLYAAKTYTTTTELLLEPLPSECVDSNEYEDLIIHSLNPNTDIMQISKSLIELSQYLDDITHLYDSESNHYYLRKVESGSLLTVITTISAVVIATVKLFDFCYTKYMSWKELYYTDKEHSMKLAVADIDAAKKVLELNPNIKDTDELIEKACVRIFKYFGLNPEFEINGKRYKTDGNIPLIAERKSESEITGDDNKK